MSAASPPPSRFLADAMLGALARWLRVLDVDVAMALRCWEVLRRTGLSRATIYRLMARGDCPR